MPYNEGHRSEPRNMNKKSKEKKNSSSFQTFVHMFFFLYNRAIEDIEEKKKKTRIFHILWKENVQDVFYFLFSFFCYFSRRNLWTLRYCRRIKFIKYEE